MSGRPREAGWSGSLVRSARDYPISTQTSGAAGPMGPAPSRVHCWERHDRRMESPDAQDGWSRQPAQRTEWHRTASRTGPTRPVPCSATGTLPSPPVRRGRMGHCHRLVMTFRHVETPGPSAGPGSRLGCRAYAELLGQRAGRSSRSRRTPLATARGPTGRRHIPCGRHTTRRVGRSRGGAAASRRATRPSTRPRLFRHRCAWGEPPFQGFTVPSRDAQPPIPGGATDRVLVPDERRRHVERVRCRPHRRT